MLKAVLDDMRTIAALAATTAALLPSQAEAQGLPVNTGPHAPVALWFIGAFVLGGALLYGIIRNRRRSRAEKQLSEQATRDNYRHEGRNG
jgi:membrane protein YqaA with SNARE-associated domain